MGAHIMRVRVVGTGWIGAPGLNTFYFHGATTDPVTADATDVVARVRAFFQAIIANLSNDTHQQVSNAVDVIDDADGSLLNGLAGTAVADVVGTGTGLMTPPADCILLQHRTNLIVRKRRLVGRSFISRGDSNDLAANGTWTSGLGTAVATAAAAMITGSTASYPVVWSRPIKDINGNVTTPGSSGGVSTYNCPIKVAVLRSRRD